MGIISRGFSGRRRRGRWANPTRAVPTLLVYPSCPQDRRHTYGSTAGNLMNNGAIACGDGAENNFVHCLKPLPEPSVRS